MCIFQKVRFEMYTTEPRPKEEYYLMDETEKDHRARMRVKRNVVAEENRRFNTNTKLPEVK